MQSRLARYSIYIQVTRARSRNKLISIRAGNHTATRPDVTGARSLRPRSQHHRSIACSLSAARRSEFWAKWMFIRHIPKLQPCHAALRTMGSRSAAPTLSPPGARPRRRTHIPTHSSHGQWCFRAHCSTARRPPERRMHRSCHPTGSGAPASND